MPKFRLRKTWTTYFKSALSPWGEGWGIGPWVNYITWQYNSFTDISLDCVTGGNSTILPIYVCATPKGMVFESFWSWNGYITSTVTPPLKKNRAERRGRSTQANRCFAFIYSALVLDLASFIVMAFTHSCFTKDLLFILLLIILCLV